MDRRRKNFLARGGLASADEMLDAVASGVAGDEAGVMGEIDNEPGGSGSTHHQKPGVRVQAPWMGPGGPRV